MYGEYTTYGEHCTPCLSSHQVAAGAFGDEDGVGGLAVGFLAGHLVDLQIDSLAGFQVERLAAVELGQMQLEQLEVPGK